MYYPGTDGVVFDIAIVDGCVEPVRVRVQDADAGSTSPTAQPVGNPLVLRGQDESLRIDGLDAIGYGRDGLAVIGARLQVDATDSTV